MNCEYVRDNLSAYMDKEIDEPLARSVEEHLQGCGACRDYYERLRSVSEALNVWEEAEPPVLLKRSIMEQVRSKRRISAMNLFLPVAAVLIIAVSVFLIYGEKGNRNTEIKRSAPLTIAESKDIAHERKVDAGNGVDEDEIIANLQMFQEKDFYDSMDTMKELDYLPLVDDHDSHHGNEKTSSLELMTA